MTRYSSLLCTCAIFFAAACVATADENPKEVGRDERRLERPEERGEDFSGLSTSDVVARLSASTERVELRKLAQILGDRSKAERFQLSEQEKETVNQVVLKNLALAKSHDANERAEARQQIERLW